jgi:branched-chain amino acid transport system ATP-binding protein
MNAAESLDLVGFIKTIRERFDLTILMIEHHMDVVTNLCDRVTALNFGSVIAEGSIEALKRNPEVIAAYLGKPQEAPASQATPSPQKAPPASEADHA